MSKFNNTLIDTAEDLDVAMPMYNLIEYSKSYRKTTGSLWNYYRDELTDDTNDNDIPNKNVINSESFKNTRQVSQGVLITLMQKLPMQTCIYQLLLYHLRITKDF